jgi:crotonobetaine/carnitine-CoA ligase
MTEASKENALRVMHGAATRDLGPYSTRFPLEQRTILRALRHQAARYGEKAYLIYDGKDVLTYAEADRLTNRVGNAILSSVGAGKHVGIFLRNQYEFMPAEDGALAVGVAVPLNADARGPLLQSQIERADVTVLLVRHELLDAVATLSSLGQVELVVVVGGTEFPQRIVGVPTIGWETWVGRESSTLDLPEPRYNDLAVLAFTSGTTGRAKAVMHSHYYWYLFSSTIAESLEHRDTDIFTSPLPQYHGGSLHLIANGSLHAGATGCLQARFSPRRFWADAARDQATYAFLLGPIAALIDKVVPEDEVPEHQVRSIYCLPSPPNRPDWEKKFRTKILRQGWAMTEIFPCVMQQEQIEGQPEDSIGWPVAWFDYGVVDEDDNMVAPGEVGELVFRSLEPYAMFSGYYGDPTATIDAFRHFWFHTGDAASYEPDGMLRFRGRLKERIRRRGEMVTAGEIEYVALLHADVHEAAAYGVPEALGEEDIKLDVVVADQLDLEKFHGWLKRNLPKFMIPRYVEIRASFPKTPSERIEKYKLKELPVDRPEVFDAGDGARIVFEPAGDHLKGSDGLSESR